MSGEWDRYPSWVQRLLFMWHHLVLASARSSVRCRAIIWDDCAVLWIRGVSERVWFFGVFLFCVLVIKGRRGSSDWCTVLHGGWFTMLGGVRLLGLLNRGWNPLVWHSYELVQTQTHISFLFLLYRVFPLFIFFLFISVWFVPLSHIHPHKDKHINKYIFSIYNHTLGRQLATQAEQATRRGLRINWKCKAPVAIRQAFGHAYWGCQLRTLLSLCRKSKASLTHIHLKGDLSACERKQVNTRLRAV